VAVDGSATSGSAAVDWSADITVASVVDKRHRSWKGMLRQIRNCFTIAR
jgi:hypothetical protein